MGEVILLTNKNIARLIKRTAQGDTEAAGELYEACRGFMYAAAVSVTRSPCLADDATQDAFVRIFRHAGDYSEELGDAVPWMLSIVRNTSADVIRKRGIIADDEGNIPDEDERSSDRGENENRMLESCMLRDALASLDERERGIIIRYDLAGMTMREIEKETGIPRSSISDIRKKALEKLRDRLQ